MFPRSRRRRQQEETEADEDSMASRLQLDMGTLLFVILEYYTYCSVERDILARKSAKGADKAGGVNVFRGIDFDDWLRLFMQVRHILSLKIRCSLRRPVLLYANEARGI